MFYFELVTVSHNSYSIQTKYRYQSRSEVYWNHVANVVSGQTVVKERTFDNYVERGTQWAALGYAGSVYLLMMIAATDKVT